MFYKSERMPIIRHKSFMSMSVLYRILNSLARISVITRINPFTPVLFSFLGIL